MIVSVMLGAMLLGALPTSISTYLEISMLGRIRGPSPTGMAKGATGPVEEQSTHCTIRQETPDDYDRVVAYYIERAGATRRNFTGTHVTVYENGSDHPRPVRVAVIERHWTYGLATAIISRATTEDKTHVVMMYRTSYVPGPDDRPPAVPGPNRIAEVFRTGPAGADTPADPMTPRRHRPIRAGESRGEGM